MMHNTNSLAYTDKTKMIQATIYGGSLDYSLLTQSFRIRQIDDQCKAFQ